MESSLDQLLGDGTEEKVDMSQNGSGLGDKHDRKAVKIP